MDCTNTKQADRVLGSMANLQCCFVSGWDPTLLQFCQLSCFCYGCLGYGTQNNCHQSEHVQRWTLHRLNPRAATQAC